MKHADFYISLEFIGSAGFRWRCTGVGTRTVLAIQLDRDDDPNWYQGPPYIAKEVVFDEHELTNCNLTEEDAISAALHEGDTSAHPGFPGEVISHMMRARMEEGGTQYPHGGVLRFDRRMPDGEILHPFRRGGTATAGSFDCIYRSRSRAGKCPNTISSRCRSQPQQTCMREETGRQPHDLRLRPNRGIRRIQSRLLYVQAEHFAGTTQGITNGIRACLV